MSNPLESEIIARAVGGDADALTELLERCGPTLCARLQHQIGARWQSVMDVDDVMQVTFLEVFLRIDQFDYRGPGSFEAWITRIAKNNLLDAIRALETAKQLPPEKRITHRDDMESSIALLVTLGITSGTPSRVAVAQEMHVSLRKAVDGIPRDYSRVITLYDLECKSVQEVAQLMERSPGAIYMLRARALDFLRESLGSDSLFGG